MKILSLQVLFIFLLIHPLVSKAGTVPQFISFSIESVLDTVPDDGYIYDTITVYDKETYKERTVIYRTKIEGYQYDTLIIFDPETYEEIIRIEKVAYGSHKEKVEPESSEDKLRKQLECYSLKWGAIKHNFVFGSPNRVFLNPKMVSELLDSNIEVIAKESCTEVTQIFSLNMNILYDNGDKDLIAKADQSENRQKLKKHKRKNKVGTIYQLENMVIETGDVSLKLPYIQFVVK